MYNMHTHTHTLIYTQVNEMCIYMYLFINIPIIQWYSMVFRTKTLFPQNQSILVIVITELQV